MGKRSQAHCKIQISPCFTFKAELTNKTELYTKTLITLSDPAHTIVQVCCRCRKGSGIGLGEHEVPSLTARWRVYTPKPCA